MTWLITRLICHNARKITGSLELTEMPVIKSDSLLKLELAENKIHTIKEGSFLPKLDSLNLDDFLNLEDFLNLDDFPQFEDFLAD